MAQTFGCARFAYNWALWLRSDAYHTTGATLRYGDTSAALTALKRQPEYAWLNDVSSVPVQQALRHLDGAFQRFFRGEVGPCRAGSQPNGPGFPSFKSKRNKQSAEYTTSAYRLKDSGTEGQPLVYLAKQKNPLKIRWSRPLPSAPKTVTVTRDSAGRYFVSFRVTLNPALRLSAIPLPPKTKAIGLDMGLTHTLITSNGWKAHNPKYLKQDLDKLRRAQKALSRKQAPRNGAKGSKNREKARRKVAKIQARITDRRNDFLHQLTTRLVRENQTICVETLRVQNMMRNHCLAQSIADVSWHELVRQLEYKCDWYGRNLVKIDQWYPSSKRCSECGHVVGKMPLALREWVCMECGAVHDRDVNAAKNILAAGLAVSASGLDVRPVGVGRESALASIGYSG